MTDGMNGILMKPLSKAALADVLATHQGQWPSVPTSAIDHDHNAETRDVLGAEGYARLAARFAQEAEDLLVWLHGAADTDLTEIAARSHKIAGSAAVFGAKALQSRLKQIETAAKADDRDRVTSLIAKLDTVWAQTRDALT